MALDRVTEIFNMLNDVAGRDFHKPFLGQPRRDIRTRCMDEIEREVKELEEHITEYNDINLGSKYRRLMGEVSKLKADMDGMFIDKRCPNPNSNNIDLAERRYAALIRIDKAEDVLNSKVDTTGKQT
jgi:hypothetical protein